MIDREFIENLPEDPFLGAVEIVNYFQSNRLKYEPDSMDASKAFIKAWIALEQYISYHKIDLTLPKLDLSTEDISSNCSAVENYFTRVGNALSFKSRERFIANAKREYANIIEGAFSYKFTDADVEEIKGLIEDLKTKIENCADFEENHKRRILKKLESLKQEIGKTLTNLDKFYGFMGEIAIFAKKYGKKAEPIVKTSWKIYRIFVAVQAIANGLPTGTELTDVNPLPLELSVNEDMEPQEEVEETKPKQPDLPPQEEI